MTKAEISLKPTGLLLLSVSRPLFSFLLTVRREKEQQQLLASRLVGRKASDPHVDYGVPMLDER